MTANLSKVSLITSSDVSTHFRPSWKKPEGAERSLRDRLTRSVDVALTGALPQSSGGRDT